MADTARPDVMPVARQKAAETQVLQALGAAVLVWLGLSFGLSGFIEDAFDGGEWVALLLPYAALAVAAFLIYNLRSEVPSNVGFAENRRRSHVIAWLIAAALLIFFALTHDFFRPLARPLGKPATVFLNFAESAGIFWGLFCVLVAAALALIGREGALVRTPGKVERTFVQNLTAKIAAVPMAFVAVGVFAGGTIWTVIYSFTDSKLLPRERWVGLDQYARLWGENRWIISIQNLMIYGVLSLILSLLIGFFLAALLDQKIRFENVFRTIFLYPFALSFIVTGLVWQWVLNPEFGIQGVIRSLGWTGFNFDPLYNPDIVIFGLLFAGLWQGTGLVMVLMLAGLRGIDEDIWKAARIDGIPIWKTYLFIVIPMMRPVFITTLVLIASGIVRLYDLVVAQTSGGPGIASEVPAKYVYDKMFLGQNLAQGFAASTMMLLAVLIVIIPWAILEFGDNKRND